MAVAYCPECGNSIGLSARPREGQRLICTECGARLEVISLRPLELDWAYDEPYCNQMEDWEEVRRIETMERRVSVDPISLGLDRRIQAQSGDLAIPSERFWVR
jgi:lysine biosynthesis protein LysW